MAAIEPIAATLRDGARMTLRHAAPADAAALLALRHAIVLEGGLTLVEPDEWTLTEARLGDSLAEYLAAPGNLYLLAERGGELAGFAECAAGGLRKTAHSASLSIYLARQWRGRGLGRALLGRLIGWAEANQRLEKLTLAVFATNEHAQALYRACGFEVEGRCPRDMKLGPGSYLDSVLMYRFV